jgi:hypothetical protein
LGLVGARAPGAGVRLASKLLVAPSQSRARAAGEKGPRGPPSPGRPSPGRRGAPDCVRARFRQSAERAETSRAVQSESPALGPSRVPLI